MNTFFVVTLFKAELASGQWSELEALAINEFGSIGIEEFSLSEPEVDQILGDRSYSGGDLPQEVLDEVENVVKSGPVTIRFFFEDGSLADSFYQEASKKVLGEIQLEENPVEDWNAEWKKHYAPIAVNEKLVVIPSWEKGFKTNSEQTIYINPGMGFGTGSHETTFLCLKLFTERVSGKIENVLDFGSGSGILGLASLKFYPEAKVDFYDIDPEANENCFENATINGLADKKFRLLLPEYRKLLQPKYDLVFANILENVLREESEALINWLNPGASLILSGLLKHQAQGIIDLYKSQLDFEIELNKGDWSALLFRRKP